LINVLSKSVEEYAQGEKEIYNFVITLKEGRPTCAQSWSFLFSLRMKDLTVEEVTGVSGKKDDVNAFKTIKLGRETVSPIKTRIPFRSLRK